MNTNDDNDWGMFTHAGDIAVSHIVKMCVQASETKENAYDLIVGELEKLEKISVFAEATDTDVRERVWSYVNSVYTVPMFATTRKKG